MNDIPLRYRDRTLTGFEAATPSTQRALDAAHEFVRGSIRSLVLLGPPGVGKSHLAAGICNAIGIQLLERYARKRKAAIEHFEVVSEPKYPEWCNVPELVVQLRSEMNREEHAASDRAARLATHKGVVVLDDLGRERISDWTGELVYTLVNSRYESRLPTIATSNLRPDELVDGGYGPAISRLAEDGVLVRIEATDRRLQAAGRRLEKVTT